MKGKRAASSLPKGTSVIIIRAACVRLRCTPRRTNGGVRMEKVEKGLVATADMFAISQSSGSGCSTREPRWSWPLASMRSCMALSPLERTSPEELRAAARAAAASSDTAFSSAVASLKSLRPAAATASNSSLPARAAPAKQPRERV